MVRPFHIAVAPAGVILRGPSRVRRIVDAVVAMSDAETAAELERVLRDFETRHWQMHEVFERRCGEVLARLGWEGEGLSDADRQLIGAYFCHEYSYAAAALMNPSVVEHPDQTGMVDGAKRVILSLRSVGEGHISSIAFREGILGPGASFELAPEPPFATAARAVGGDLDPEFEGPVTVERNPDSTISGTVMFPVTPMQSNGLEDLRMVGFTHDDGRREVLGTYTAYNGRQIQSELMRTRDFRTFDLRPMSGSAARNKGMAIFPRTVGGRYWTLGRQDGENLFIIDSDSPGHWDEGRMLLTPKYSWEMVQIGNCGSPIELDEGWLVLTHGVGAMRKYSIGACLLDKHDPSKVLARTPEPVLSAADEDREGYVPNVVYTCGALRHGDHLFIPYGVADSSVAFAFVPIKALLEAMVEA